MGNQRLWTSTMENTFYHNQLQTPRDVTRVRKMLETLLLRDQQPALSLCCPVKCGSSCINGGCIHGRYRKAQEWVNLSIGKVSVANNFARRLL